MFESDSLAAFVWSETRHPSALQRLLLHFRLGFGISVLRQTQDLAFHFRCLYKVKLQPFQSQAKLLSAPQPTRMLTGLGFVLGWGVAVAGKILVQMEEGVMGCRRGWRATRSKQGKAWHPSRNSCWGNIQFVIFICVCLYSRAKCFSSPLEIWRWVFHSFGAIHWCKLALV